MRDMTKVLTKKRRAWGGQRTALKKIIQQAEAAFNRDIDAAQLTAMKLSLTKKMMLVTLDDKVTNLLKSEEDIHVAQATIQSDEYKHKIYTTIACIENALEGHPRLGLHLLIPTR